MVAVGLMSSLGEVCDPPLFNAVLETSNFWPISLKTLALEEKSPLLKGQSVAFETKSVEGQPAAIEAPTPSSGWRRVEGSVSPAAGGGNPRNPAEGLTSLWASRQPRECCSPFWRSRAVWLSLCRSARCTASSVRRLSVLCHAPYDA